MVDMNSDEIRARRRIAQLRDLSDFCNCWNEIRNVAEASARKLDGTDKEAADTLDWLIILADKVCIDALTPLDEKSPPDGQ